MATDLEILGTIAFEGVATEGVDTPEALEHAMFTLTEWLTAIGAQPGDELLLIRRPPKEENAP